MRLQNYFDTRKELVFQSWEEAGQGTTGSAMSVYAAHESSTESELASVWVCMIALTSIVPEELFEQGYSFEGDALMQDLATQLEGNTNQGLNRVANQQWGKHLGKTGKGKRHRKTRSSMRTPAPKHGQQSQPSSSSQRVDEDDEEDDEDEDDKEQEQPRTPVTEVMHVFAKDGHNAFVQYSNEVQSILRDIEADSEADERIKGAVCKMGEYGLRTTMTLSDEEHALNLHEKLGLYGKSINLSRYDEVVTAIFEMPASEALNEDTGHLVKLTDHKLAVRMTPAAVRFSSAMMQHSLDIFGTICGSKDVIGVVMALPGILLGRLDLSQPSSMKACGSVQVTLRKAQGLGLVRVLEGPNGRGCGATKRFVVKAPSPPEKKGEAAVLSKALSRLEPSITLVDYRATLTKTTANDKVFNSKPLALQLVKQLEANYGEKLSAGLLEKISSLSAECQPLVKGDSVRARNMDAWADLHFVLWELFKEIADKVGESGIYMVSDNPDGNIQCTSSSHGEAQTPHGEQGAETMSEYVSRKALEIGGMLSPERIKKYLAGGVDGMNESEATEPTGSRAPSPTFSGNLRFDGAAAGEDED